MARILQKLLEIFLDPVKLFQFNWLTNMDGHIQELNATIVSM